MAITGRVRIDLTHIPSTVGLPAYGYEREAAAWLYSARHADLSPGTPFTVRVGALAPATITLDRDAWADFAETYDNILIESDDPENVARWVGALRALAVERTGGHR